jgi:anti-sigma factor RsiW
MMVTSMAEFSPPTDADLVAYLDGELDEAARQAIAARLGDDAALRARLDRLKLDTAELGQAFGILLAGAPSDRLATILSRAEATASAARPASAGSNWSPMRIAAAILIFLIGAAAGYFGPRVLPGAEAPDESEVAEDASAGWRQVVAEYLLLYTPDTLASIPDDAALRAEELSTVASKLAVDVTPENVALPDLALKRAQLFEFKGKPLAQIAYLSKEGPIAFCIIANGKPDAAPAYEERLGENIVFWTKGGRGFMVIGKAPRDKIEAVAATLGGRIA